MMTFSVCKLGYVMLKSVLLYIMFYRVEKMYTWHISVQMGCFATVYSAKSIREKN